ncbi:MAG: glycosyltransferase family 2 protein [Lachnospiraceae bacterium]|nr:glycosyltransferase family 2 protein [Lachnospiraceae bacterium]
MKILTVAIPCYNSAEYMGKAIKSVLTAGDDVEIIVVDDGSTDNTKEVAEKYAAEYPDIVKVVSKENGGHGSAVNEGLKHAAGAYFKVLDSDDWFDRGAFEQVMKLLHKMIEDNICLDMVISNYVYEKPSIGKKRIINYRSAMPVNELFTWSELKHFKLSQNILMHSVIYRTQMLRDCGLELPKHTFYVDNIFVYQPLPSVKLMYYLDVDLYRYFIGREDQSVNESVMIRRIDQQIKVNKLMMDSHDLTKIENDKLRHYMVKYLAMITTVSSALLVKEGTSESLKKRKKLWLYLKTSNPGMYKMVNNTMLGRPMQMRTFVGRKIIIFGYKMSQKIFGFS